MSPIVLPLVESGRSVLRLRPLPVVLLTVIGNMSAVFGPPITLILSLTMLSWFVMAEIAGGRDDERKAEQRSVIHAQRTVELLRDAMRGDRVADERNSLVVDMVRLGDRVSLIISDMGHEARYAFERFGGKDIPDEKLAEILAAERARAVERFNREALDDLGRIAEKAESVKIQVGHRLAKVIKDGAVTMDDVNITFADLDNLSRQLVYGIYEEPA